MWDAEGRAVAGPCLQRVLAAVGLSQTFLILGGSFTISALVAFLFKPTAQSKEKKVMCDNRKNHRWFDFSVIKHKPYMSFVVATGVLSVAFSVTFVHVVSQVNRPLPSGLWPHANQTHFRMKDFARGLVLKERHNITRKWPILHCVF